MAKHRAKGRAHSVKWKQVSGVGFQVSGMKIAECGKGKHGADRHSVKGNQVLGVSGDAGCLMDQLDRK